MLEKVADASEEVVLRPRKGFVVKTKLALEASNPKRAKGTKVFLNICSDDHVPLPEVAYDAKVIYPLIMENRWEIPIVASEFREDKDKKGVLAYVYDCIINTKAMRWIQMDNELREILIEWSLESVELRSDISLSREDIAIPKMSAKGEPHEIKILKSEMDLNKLNREFEERVSRLENDPVSILEAQRHNVDQEMKDSEEIDIFNTNRAEKIQRKPLIQEIEEMSITTPRPKKEAIREKEELKYEVNMQKIDINDFKLKIEIKSQNDSSLDYDLQLNRSTNTLILKNLNHKYSCKKDFELQLPAIFEKPNIKSFFVHKSTTLVVFVK